MKIRSTILILISVFFGYLYFAQSSFAQVCSGGGDAYVQEDYCETNYIGRYCVASRTSVGYQYCSGPSCERIGQAAGLQTYCSGDCSMYYEDQVNDWYTSTGCYWDYTGTAPEGGSGEPPPGGSDPTPLPTNTPTPTPTPRPDLSVTAFKLVGVDGKDKAIDPLHWDLPLFYTGEDVCPVTTLANLSVTSSISTTGNTWTSFYADTGSGTTPPAYNTPSDTDIYLKNGQFGAKYSKTYAAYLGGLNNTFYTYKTASNNG